MAKVDERARYTDTHEWARLEGDLVVLGITDYAQSQLNDIVYVELPEVGSLLRKGEPYAVVESVKAASDCYAPLSGEVVEVNTRLESDPGLVNRDPYGEGWFVRVRPANLEELSTLRSASSYLELLSETGAE